MFKYRALTDLKFRAGVSVEEPWNKKVYSVKRGEIFNSPVGIIHANLELVESIDVGDNEVGEMRSKKKKTRRKKKESE